MTNTFVKLTETKQWPNGDLKAEHKKTINRTYKTKNLNYVN